MTAPFVAIITLNWNQPHYTLACLKSLNAVIYANFMTIVVDNGSKDDSVAQIAGLLPQLDYKVEVIVNTHNLGFAEGNNVGIRRALDMDADYVLLLNNDTEVAPDFIEPLVHMAESDPRIGITGPKIYYYDDPQRIWSAGGFFTRSGWTQQRGVDSQDSPEFNYAKAVDYVTGCALLIKREVIEKIGMLDARFFIYYEETDWCARAKKAGYTIWYVPQSVLWHKISLVARGLSPNYVYLMTRNRLLFMRNMGIARPLIWLSVVAVDIRTIIAWTVWKRHSDKRAMRKVRMRGVFDYLRGNFGQPHLASEARIGQVQN